MSFSVKPLNLISKTDPILWFEHHALMGATQFIVQPDQAPLQFRDMCSRLPTMDFCLETPDMETFVSCLDSNYNLSDLLTSFSSNFKIGSDCRLYRRDGLFRYVPEPSNVLLVSKSCPTDFSMEVVVACNQEDIDVLASDIDTVHVVNSAAAMLDIIHNSPAEFFVVMRGKHRFIDEIGIPLFSLFGDHDLAFIGKHQDSLPIVAHRCKLMAMCRSLGDSLLFGRWSCYGYNVLCARPCVIEVTPPEPRSQPDLFLMGDEDEESGNQ